MITNSRTNETVTLTLSGFMFQKEVEMRSNDPSDLLISQIKEGPTIRERWKEEVKFEIERLKDTLRDPALTEEAKAIAQSQIANYQEMLVMAARLPADWLRQI